MALTIDAPQSGVRTLAGSSARALGAYYTPSVAASFMARWALRGGPKRVLEPSMGDGEFLRAVSDEARRSGTAAELWGVELAEDTFRGAIGQGLVDPGRAIFGDFLGVAPFEVDVVIGNPPYVRLRHLPKVEAVRATLAAEARLGVRMDPAGSVWMPFVLHASRFLGPGGRLAFVLPYDFTYLRYARSLWSHLGSTFGSLKVVRVHDRLFPDVLQEAILLLADGQGGSTEVLEFEAYASAAHLSADEPLRQSTVELARVVSGERAFVDALLSPELLDLLCTKVEPKTVPVKEKVAFNIGYVCGDKDYFHPTGGVLREFNLPSSSLRKAISSSRSLSGSGIRTADLPQNSLKDLFLPPADSATLSEGELEYVASGVSTGVSSRYKCRNREPWFVTPDVRVPDLVLPTFSDRPVLRVNDAGAVVSNSMLAGFLRTGTAEGFASAWYTTLTLLEIERRVHSLGGGVMIFIPGETGAIRVAKEAPATGHLGLVDAALKTGDVGAAYEVGDEIILARQFGLSLTEIALIKDGLATLRFWRRDRGSRNASVEHVPEDQSLLERLDETIDESIDGHVEVGH